MDNINSSSASAIVDAFIKAIVGQVMHEMCMVDNESINSLAERVRRIEDSYVNKEDVVRIAESAARAAANDAINAAIDRKVEHAVTDAIDECIDRKIDDAIDDAIEHLRITR